MYNNEFMEFLRGRGGKLAFFDVYGTLIPNYGYAKIENETIDFLNKLHRNKVVLGIISNCDDRILINRILEEAHVEDLFSVIVLNDEGKSHTERLFRAIKKAKEKSNINFKPQDIYHFDDDYRRIKDSRILGINHIMISDDPKVKLSVFPADFLIPNFINHDRILSFMKIENKEKIKTKS